MTPATIEKDIEKLRHRIRDLKCLDPSSIQFDDAPLKAVRSHILHTIHEVFGKDSPELREHQLQAKMAAGVPQTITRLEGLIKRLEEKREDLVSEEAHGPVATSSDTLETCKGHCPTCEKDLNADIVASFSEKHDYPDTHGMWSIFTYLILRCRGCDQVYFQLRDLFSEDAEWETDPEPTTETLWPLPKKRSRPPWLNRLDVGLQGLLDEVYGALDADLRVLAAIGTRTALDHAMVSIGAREASGFGQKLDQLLEEKTISEDEKEMLAKLTDAGSAAAHRGWRPQPEGLDTLIEGVEAFLHRSLVLKKTVDENLGKVPARPQRPSKSEGNSKP